MIAKIIKAKASFKRIKDTKGPDHVIGNFLLEINITATDKAIHIPLSIASGKKATGFVYQIEGTDIGKIITTDIDSEGAGLTQITSGTIVYSKIPTSKTATFSIKITMKGKVGKTYGIVINTINYKFDPKDSRYQKFEIPLKSGVLKFA